MLNGAIGADLRIPFPIAVRASYGYWFSYFCVVSRAILAAFWLGVQSVGGGSAVTSVSSVFILEQMLSNIQRVGNHLHLAVVRTPPESLTYFCPHHHSSNVLLLSLPCDPISVLVDSHVQTSKAFPGQVSSCASHGNEHSHLDLCESAWIKRHSQSTSDRLWLSPCLGLAVSYDIHHWRLLHTHCQHSGLFSLQQISKESMVTTPCHSNPQSRHGTFWYRCDWSRPCCVPRRRYLVSIWLNC